MARHVNQDIIDGKLDTNAKMSATIQQRIASMLFSDSEDEYAEFANTPVRSINATKAKMLPFLSIYLDDSVIILALKKQQCSIFSRRLQK